jgi:hypothetical protein
MCKKNEKNDTQKIINITRLNPIERNTLLTNKNQNKSYFKRVKNERKIIKIEKYFSKIGKQEYSKSIEIKKRRTMPILKKKGLSSGE